jgi:antitoxin component YwqK of YwqJK toxin-antitoxin module
MNTEIIKTYYPNGNVKFETPYKNDQIHGIKIYIIS